MRPLAESLGIAVPDAPNFVSVSAASLIILATLAAGWAAGKWAGPHVANFLERKAGERGEALVPRICAILRYLIVWLVLMLVLRADAWPPVSALLLGLFAAVAAGLVVRHGARALQLPRWASWLLAAFLFVAILADAVGGLKPVTTHARPDRLHDRQPPAVAAHPDPDRWSLWSRSTPWSGSPTGWSSSRSGAPPASIRPSGCSPRSWRRSSIIAIAFFVAIDLAGIDLTALAVFSGALGLAVGFGLQKTFGNLIAGIILLLDRSIKPGDVISVGETFGSVNKIGVRAVSIVTRDGKEYLIPNEILMTQEVVNWSYSTRDVRISIPIGIAYDCDVKLAHRLMVEAATASPRVLEAPKPVVWMTAFGENAIDHEISGLDRAIPRPASAASAPRSSSRLLELFTRARHPSARSRSGTSGSRNGREADRPPSGRSRPA